MEFNTINKKLKNLFGIKEKYGKLLYDLIVNNQLKNILEIGFAYGKSSLYMAAALEENKDGKITTIDLKTAMNNNPNILESSKEIGLEDYIYPVFSDISGNWELRKIIIERTKDNFCAPLYDLCFIDAFHSWEMAGFDFFLCDKLLLPGGWMIFDDITWSFEKSPSWSKKKQTKEFPLDYRGAMQVGDVFNYLVRQHLNYFNFKVVGNFGIAQKRFIAC